MKGKAKNRETGESRANRNNYYDDGCSSVPVSGPLVSRALFQLFNLKRIESMVSDESLLDGVA